MVSKLLKLSVLLAILFALLVFFGVKGGKVPPQQAAVTSDVTSDEIVDNSVQTRSSKHSATAPTSEPEDTDAIARSSETSEPENQEALQIRLLDLNEKADEAERSGDIPTAIIVLEQVIALQEQFPGKYHTSLAGTLGRIARLHIQQDDFASARATQQRVLTISVELYGESDWRVTDARWALVYTEKVEELNKEDWGDLRNAETSFREARNTGNLEIALMHANTMRQLEKLLLGTENPWYANSLEYLGNLYAESGEFQKSKKNYRESLEIRKKVLGEEHPRIAGSLTGIAYGYQRDGNYVKAEALFQRSLEITRNVLGEGHPNMAIHFTNLANIYVDLLDFVKAESLRQGSLEITRKVFGEEHPTTAGCLALLADLYMLLVDYAKAEPLYQQVLKINRKVFGEEHPNTAESLNSLAFFYQTMGDYVKAEPLYQQVLKINRKVFGEEHPNTAESLNFLASFYRTMGDYVKAEPLYLGSLEITRKVFGGEHPNTAESLSSLAYFYLTMGEYAKAEPLYQQSLEINRKVFGDENPRYGKSLQNLGMLYAETGEIAKAEPLLQRSLEINRKAFGEDNADTADSLDALAFVYQIMGECAKAEPLYQQSLEINRKVSGEEHSAAISTTLSLLRLAENYSFQGDWAKAEPLLQQSLEINRKVFGEGHDYTISSLLGLAGYYRFRGDSQTALSLFGKILNHVRVDLEVASAVQSERQQLAMDRNLRWHLSRYISTALVAGETGGNAYDKVWYWKGSVSARQRSARLLAEHPTLAPLFNKLRSVTARLAKLTLATHSLPEPGVRQQQIADLSSQKEELERQIAGNVSGSQEGVTGVGIAELHKCLSSNGVFVDFLEYIEYMDGNRRLAAFVLRGEDSVQLIDVCSVDDIEKAIATWLTDVSSRGTSGDRLRELIWDPIESCVKDADSILYSPDGALGSFPLGALPGSTPGSYLIEEQAISVVPVPRLLPSLLASSEDKRPGHRMLALGGVNYDNVSDEMEIDITQHLSSRRAVRGESQQTFSPLPGTKVELDAIRKMHEKHFGSEGLMTLQASQASEAAFREKAPRYSYLHVATHGFFAPPHLRSALTQSLVASGRGGFTAVTDQSVQGYHPGLLSGLALAGANAPDPEGDDGILTAEEVSTLNLSGADLVVLSACDTSRGAVSSGEGLLGLQRAFQVAGARTCVASLWQVDDSATRVLMTEFYRNLWEKKLSKLESLRQSQLTMLRDYDPEKGTLSRGVGGTRPTDKTSSNRLPPHYWAAWVLSGDWR